MKYQRVPMPPAYLEETVARYNSFVESGVDADFDKPAPQHRIGKPPFYAAWATPVVHDTRAGLRINPTCQVIDMNARSSLVSIAAASRPAASASTGSPAPLVRATSPAEPPPVSRSKQGILTAPISRS